MKRIIGLLLSLIIIATQISGLAYFPDPYNWAYENTAPDVDLMGVVSYEDLKNVKLVTDFDTTHEVYNSMYVRVYYNASANSHGTSTTRDYTIERFGQTDPETGITTFTLDLSPFNVTEGFKTFGFVIYYVNTTGTKISDWVWRTVYVSKKTTNVFMDFDADFNTPEEFVQELDDSSWSGYVSRDESDGSIAIEGKKGELAVDTGIESNDAFVVSMRYKLGAVSDGSIRPAMAMTDSNRAYTNGTNGISVLMHQASSGNINITGAFKNLSGDSTTKATSANSWIELIAVVSKNKMDYVMWWQKKNALSNTQRSEQNNIIYKTGTSAYDAHTAQLQGNPSEMLRYLIFNTASDSLKMNIDYMYVARMADTEIASSSATPVEITVNFDGMISEDGLKDGISIFDDLGNSVNVKYVKVEQKTVKTPKTFGYDGKEFSEEQSKTNSVVTITPEKNLSLGKSYFLTVGAEATSYSGIALGEEKQTDFQCTYPEAVSDYQLLWAEFNDGYFDTVVKNATDAKKYYYSFVSEWDGNELIAETGEEFEVFQDVEDASETLIYTHNTDNRYEAAIIDKETLKSISYYDFATDTSEKTQALSTIFNKASGILSVSEYEENEGDSAVIIITPTEYVLENLTIADINNKTVFVGTLFADSEKKAGKDICLNSYFPEGDYRLHYIGKESKTYNFSLLDKTKAQTAIDLINLAADGTGIYNVLTENADVLKIDATMLANGGVYTGEILKATRPSTGYEYEKIFSCINEAMIASAIRSGAYNFKELLRDYGAEVEIDYTNEVLKLTDAELAYVEEFMKKQNYLTNKVKDIFDDACLLSKLFTVSRYTELEKIIIDNKEAYGVSTASYDKLSSANQAQTWEIFYQKLNEINALEDVSTVFVAAVRSALADDATPPPFYGGGGGGGSSSSGRKPSGSSSPYQGVVDTNNITVVDEMEKVLPDMEKHWAKEAVLVLYNDKIVSGYDNGNFLPNNNVSRAEFVKMVVGAFKPESNGEQISFGDVTESDWHYNYINTAVKSGIVQGDGKKFSPNSQLTRQDAAVILFRVIQKKGLNMFKQGSFGDEAEISEYALDAVKSMSGAGLVSGYEGKFNPKNNITRAETAQMVYNVMKFLGIK